MSEFERTYRITRPSRFALVIGELGAVASEELHEPLRQWEERPGRLTDSAAAELCAYLREECNGYGLLTRGARLEAGFHGATAAGIERQGQRLEAELTALLGADS